MEYQNKNGIVEISKVSERELFAFLKSQINLTLHFSEDSYINLFERTITNGKPTVNINTDTIITKEEIEYDELIDIINEKIVDNVVLIHIEKDIFKDKEPLIVILDNIKESIVDSAISLDYDFKKEMFIIEYKPLPNGSNKLYFFELDNSVLIFAKDGPKIIENHSKINSIEDILCNK